MSPKTKSFGKLAEKIDADPEPRPNPLDGFDELRDAIGMECVNALV